MIKYTNNELDRLLNLSEFDLDYSNLEDSLKDLTKLAAKIAGTEISLINIVDSLTQWTISSHGIDLKQMEREDSVCQYTILDNVPFEINDLSLDDRFKEKFYVKDTLNLRYYFGIPLTTDKGHNIGALCVLDDFAKAINPEKIELLKIIADEIVNKLKAIKVIENLKNKIQENTETHKRVAHDIRGPIGGIISLAQVISMQGEENNLEEVLMFINLIQKSGNTLLELADEILSVEQFNKIKSDEFNLLMLKEKLETLYAPQVYNKCINFEININKEIAEVPFFKNKLLQIIGNLISNSIKFTPLNGTIKVDLNLAEEDNHKHLKIKVSDTGVGMNDAAIAEILDGTAVSTDGTSGEIGYGFGLALVKHLIASLKGTLNINSTLNEGTVFEISIPQK
ncbi:GAF domain-containing sensor histidine kinase [Pedobacter alpinus]|uniref:histidine kinase n=1 Tax=Pedobacter alpinus TaxID=1590643 RepID=A0ABW5TQU0_9SPHI